MKTTIETSANSTTTRTAANVSVQRKLKRYVLRAPVVPDKLILSADLLTKIQRIELALGSQPNVDWHRAYDSINALGQNIEDGKQISSHSTWPYIAKLQHCLGRHSTERLVDEERIMRHRSLIERMVVEKKARILVEGIASTSSEIFVAALLQISAEMRGVNVGKFRKQDIKLRGDRHGWTWQFPNHNAIESCLHELHRVLHEKSLGSALVEATITYLILNWIHAFPDGNGRTSRGVFNILLQRKVVSSQYYLPIKEINYLAQGGHEIRLRYAVATNEFEDLLDYFVNAAALYEEILRSRVDLNNQVDLNFAKKKLL